MAGRTPALAVESFLGPLRRTISCVTAAVLNVGGGYQPGQLHALTLAAGTAVPLQSSDQQISLRLAHHYRIVEDVDLAGPWRVKTAGYLYSLEVSDESEILAFHWHPEGKGPITVPHVHIERASGATFPGLIGAHLPTGRVTVEEVIRFAITELGVGYRRDDWEQVLDRGQEDHEVWRTWH